MYGLLLVPWHLFSWVALGSLVPDTLLIKRGQEAWGGVSFPTGLAAYYLRRFPAATVTSLAMLPFAALLWGRASPPVRRVAGLAAGYAVLHYIAYSALRVPPYHWYYAPAMLASVVLGALGCGAAWASGVAWRRAAAGLALAVPAAGVAVLVADGLPPREAPIHSNWATHDQYRAIGLALRDLVRPEETVTVTGEIGTLAFYSERRLANYFSDRNEVAVPRSAGGARLASIPLAGPLLRGLADRALALNARWRAPLPPLGPPAYALRLVPGGAPAASDPDVVATWHTSSRWLPQGMTATLRRTP